MLWVLSIFLNAVRDSAHEAAWSVELMVPLIANLFPDLCRLRSELPELISVCVNRYMEESIAAPRLSVPKEAMPPPAPHNDTSVLASFPPAAPSAMPGAMPARMGAGAAGEVASAPAAAIPPVPNVPVSGNNVAPVAASAQRGMGPGAAAGLGGASGSSGPMVVATQATPPLLASLRKLVQSVLSMCPEAFVWLSPGVQAAWRLIESECNISDPAALRAALRADALAAPPPPPSWLGVSAAWVHCARATVPPGAAAQPAAMRLRLLDALDRCCFSAAACDLSQLRALLRQPRGGAPAGWHEIHEEYRKARVYAPAACTWAASYFRCRIPGAMAVAVTFLGALNESLLALCDAGAPGADGARAPPGDYPLQGLIEDFVDSFEPASGFDEETGRLEALLSELIRNAVFDHTAWVLNMVARGVFEGTLDENPAARKHRRLLANLPNHPGRRFDSCQRRVLLRSARVLDMGPYTQYYARKIVCFLFWGRAEFTPAGIRNVSGSAGLELRQAMRDAPPGSTSLGSIGPDEVTALEWEEAVQLAYLEAERNPQRPEDALFADGVLLSRGAGVLFRTLRRALTALPPLVRAQLARHIATVVRVAASREHAVPPPPCPSLASTNFPTVLTSPSTTRALSEPLEPFEGCAGVCARLRLA